MGVLAVSASLARTEYLEAIEIAKQIKANIITIETNELENSDYAMNDKDRCFYCKTELFSEMQNVAIKQGFPFILDGNNIDDTGDYRPGLKAAGDLGVRSPLIEVGLGKQEIRELSKILNLPNWDKPAQPCLSSRVAYGIRVDADILSKIEIAEQYIRTLDFRIIRVRYMHDSASIEVGPSEVEKLMRPEISEKVVSKLQQIGFRNIVIDKEGYKSGKLNQVLHHIQ